MRPSDWSAVARSSDPIPGDPTVVRNGGSDYLEVATAISGAVRRLRTLDLESVLKAESADALTASAEEVAANIGKAEQRYRAVGEALIAYAPALESAQQESESALLSARSAVDAAASSESTRQHYLRLANDESDQQQALVYTNLADNCEYDAQSALSTRNSAVDRVDQAVTARDTAAETAIAQIEDITGADGLNDGWWENWGKGLLTAITDIAGIVAAVAGVLALLVSWIPVVGQLAAAALLAIAGIAALVNAIGNTVLAITGDRSWLEAGLSIAGAVLSVVGMGAAVRVVAKAMTTQRVTMKVGEQITVRQALRLKPSDWSRWAGDMRTPVPQPSQGQTIFRTYGDGALPTGGSWSPTDPRVLANPRMQLGLPDNNSMQRVVIAQLDNPSAVQNVRHGLPYNGNLGGAPEYVIPWNVQNGAISVLSDVPFSLP